VDGYWNLYGGRYAWTGGYWRQPPYAGSYSFTLAQSVIVDCYWRQPPYACSYWVAPRLQQRPLGELRTSHRGQASTRLAVV